MEEIRQFLEFRKKFTQSQWQELNHIIDSQFKKKAAELKLDDEDIKEIENVINRPIVQVNLNNKQSRRNNKCYKNLESRKKEIN
ncbi:hypothetical protein [Staphylococcus aureus]|uniref:hypothetical protein n=1 Tax=Staphylococcus aureus TaxID=1280 RepID=UPI001E423F49|nr:hypothetical protein [Staphylococcus aureus]UFA53812.1 hypothetical protein LB316_01380 [Staphylococcus aureus]